MQIGTRCLGACVVASWLLIGSFMPAQAQLPPEEELATLQPADGLEVTLFASEPMITNPSCIDIDTHGRVWVAEIEWYRGRAKNPPADKIKVLEDTDGDGKADKATVFADDVFAPMSLCVLGDKVYAFVQGDLLVWEDKNGDLKADGPPEKLVGGFSADNHDHTAHSIVVGPDHKWYMAHGDHGFKATGSDGSQIESRWGAMVRGELDGSQLEVIAHNFRNPYEICVDSFGEAYCSDNDNDGNESVRICWILEGGDYGWFGGPPFDRAELDRQVPKGTPFRDAWHFRGYMPGYVPGTLVTGFGSPTGMCFYEGEAFPEFKNMPLHTDPGPRVLRKYPHTPNGAGMKASSQVWLTNEGDNYFRPDDVCVAPDGSLFISDWYDGGVGGHAYNDPNHGRIFQVRPVGQKLQRHDTPGPYASLEDAAMGLKSPNHATQFLAREKFLAEGEASIPTLVKLLADDEPNYRARALWLLDRIGGAGREQVVAQLTSDDPAFRALAVRILRRHGEQYAGRILPLADDPAGQVVREVVLACRNLNNELALPTLVKVAGQWRGEDRYLLEALNIAAQGRKPQFYDQLTAAGKANFTLLPLLQLLDADKAAGMVTAKLAEAGIDRGAVEMLLATASGVPSLDAGRAVLALALNQAADPEVRGLAIARVLANWDGAWQALAGEPGTLDALRQLLAEDSQRAKLLTEIGRLGIAALAPDVWAIAQNVGLSAEDRVQAIQALRTLNAAESLEQLRPLLGDGAPAVREAVLQALVDLQDIPTLRAILVENKYPDDIQAAAAARLMESTGGALLLLRMIERNELSDGRRQATLTAAAAHPDANIRVLFGKYLPEDQRLQTLGTAIKPEEILALTGDPARGSQIFYRSSAAQCNNCHTVRGRGKSIGPDLSMIGRKYEKAALLETILDPSKAISHEYRAQLLETSGGQVFAGFLVRKTDDEVVLKDINGNLIRVPADDVEELVEQEKSLMPELVLQQVTAQDAADLLAFLMTLTEGRWAVTQYRVAGPFAIGSGDLATPLPPETTLAAPEFSAQFTGPDGKSIKWEVVPAVGDEHPIVDSVAYDRNRGFGAENVAHYAVAVVESAAEQPVSLELGSDDGVVVWVNGTEVHRNSATRAVAPNQDRIDATLKPGRNIIALKVINGDGPGGWTLNLRTREPIQLLTE